MGKELSILAIVGSIIFGIWYLNGEGCKGDGASGITGPEGSLCWTGQTLSEMIGQAQGGTGDIPEPEEGEDEPPIDPGGSPDEIARMEAGQKRLIKQGSTGDRYPSGKPLPITPASKSSWAHAYYTNNRITVA